MLKSMLRNAVYRSEKVLQRARFASLPGQWPTLLGISFPKSGTHLLDQILLGFAQVAPYSQRLHSFYAEYEGESGRKRPREQALEWLDSLGWRDVASAHIFATPQTLTRITSPRFTPYFIFRDPRDVVVSHVFYVTEIEKHHVHHSYYQSLPNLDERLKVSILGRPDASVEFPNVAERFAPYLGWLSQPYVLKLHFEDLIHKRIETLGRILDHFLARAPVQVDRSQTLKHLEKAIEPSKSPTFRSGKTGEWAKYFTAEHKDLFKQVAGDLLIRLGYETNADW